MKPYKRCVLCRDKLQEGQNRYHPACRKVLDDLRAALYPENESAERPAPALYRGRSLSAALKRES